MPRRLQHSKNGGGIGANVRWSFAASRLTSDLHGFGGAESAATGTGGLPDVTVRDDGTLCLIKSLQGNTTLEWHYPNSTSTSIPVRNMRAAPPPIDPNLGTRYGVGYGAPHVQQHRLRNRNWSGVTGFRRAALRQMHCRHASPDRRHGWLLAPHLQWSQRPNPMGTAVFLHHSQGVVGRQCRAHGLDCMIFTSFRYYLP